MLGFTYFFKTVPISNPTTECIFWTALSVLMAVLAAVIVPLAPRFDPVLRTVLGYAAWYLVALGVSFVRRERARAAGTPFIPPQEAKERFFRWNIGQPLMLSVVGTLLFFVPTFIGAITLFRGHQMWQLDNLDSRVLLEMLALMAPLAVILQLMLRFTNWSRRYAGMIGYVAIAALAIGVFQFIPHAPAAVGALLSREWHIVSLWVAAAGTLIWHFTHQRSS